MKLLPGLLALTGLVTVVAAPVRHDRPIEPASGLASQPFLPLPPLGIRRQVKENGPRRPPLCPRWALRPWVWDDRGGDHLFAQTDANAHRSAAVLALVDGYCSHDIPVGAVVIDSPWASNYNTQTFDPRRYERPQELIAALHRRDVRVVLWMTAIMNDGSDLFSDDTDFRSALSHGYLILGRDGGLEHWWKGDGGLIDFYNRRAVDWWHGLMDRAIDLGIDGWKVDKIEASLPTDPETLPEKESPTVSDYRRHYFRDTYRYLVRRRADGVVIQRPFYGRTVADTPAAWVGDQTHSWRGLRSALHLVLGGAHTGVAVVGSDIGGYLGGARPDKTLYLRWAQFGALCPLMETGGQGERRPWKIDAETTRIFRYWATLHTELIPYLYTWMVEDHLTGRPLLRGWRPTGALGARGSERGVGDGTGAAASSPSHSEPRAPSPERARRAPSPQGADRGEYLLGPDLLVSVVLQPATRKDVSLPAGEWIDYWDETKCYRGPGRLHDYPAPLDRLPLFIRRGAILPMEVTGDVTGHGDAASAGRLTLLIDPHGAASLAYRYETGPQTFGEATVAVTETAAGVTISWRGMPRPLLLRVRRSTRPAAVCEEVSGVGMATLPEGPTGEVFDQLPRGWRWEPARGLIWVKPTATTMGSVTLDEGGIRPAEPPSDPGAHAQGG